MPSRWGRYEVVRQLGAGGQGSVYEARLRGARGFERRVAVKVLQAGADVRREARLSGLLRHPHVVDVYEVGEQGGQWFCAMDLCDGTLEAPARRGLSTRAVVEVGLAVCDALQYAHDALGLVHLDLKPANLLLCGATVKVADLGLAVARGFERDGRRAGTPGFMAPEQERGDAVDARTDVFALGVTLGCLAGRPTAAGETVELPPEGEAGPAAEGPPGPDDPLDEVLGRATARHPRDRFASMAELAEALRRVPVEGPTLALHLGLADPPPAPRGRVFLPAEADAFVGRLDEQVALAWALAEHRCVVLRGAPGVGKSRLARRAARSWHVATDDGVAWCTLTAVRDRAGLHTALAEALDVPVGPGSGAALADRVVAALAARGPSLLVLDDGEGVSDVAGPTLDALLAGAPDARVVVSTRVAPRDAPLACVLDLPPLTDDDARALVVERASERGVELGSSPALGVLLDALGGLPLALELAAGRMGVLSAEEVADRLGLADLRSARPGPSQRSTVEGALAWSWDLLDPPGRELLEALSAFAGSFTVADAEAEAGRPPGAGAQALARLREVGLLAVDTVAAARRGHRFVVPRLVRAFAAARLGAAPGPALRHARWFGRLGDPALVEEARWRDPVAADLRDGLDELVVAAGRAADLGEPDLCAACAIAAQIALHRWGPAELRLPLLRRAFDAGPTRAWRARLYEALARAQKLAGSVDEARRAAEQGLALVQGDADTEVLLLETRGHLDLYVGDLDRAGAAFERARRVADASGSVRLRAVSALMLAGHRRRERRFEEAAAFLDLAKDAFARTGCAVQASKAHAARALLLVESGDYEGAVAAGHYGLALLEGVDAPDAEVGQRANLANLLLEIGRPAEAGHHVVRGLALARRIGAFGVEAALVGAAATQALMEERWDEACALAAKAEAIHVRAGAMRSVLANRMVAAQARRDGGGGALVTQFRELVEAARALCDPYAEGTVRLELACSLAMAGAGEDARAELDAAVRLRVARPQRFARFAEWMCRARVAALLGRPDEALAAVTEAASVFPGHPALAAWRAAPG